MNQHYAKVIDLLHRITDNESLRDISIELAKDRPDLFVKYAARLGVAAEPWRKKVIEALRNGEKIKAIKEYRDAAKVSLKEAKDEVEEIQAKYHL